MNYWHAYLQYSFLIIHNSLNRSIHEWQSRRPELIEEKCFLFICLNAYSEGIVELSADELIPIGS